MTDRRLTKHQTHQRIFQISTTTMATAKIIIIVAVAVVAVAVVLAGPGVAVGRIMIICMRILFGRREYKLGIYI